ncbi:SRPBCC domain-containing protein [Spongiactinospora sp. TRM90649]|uniref:SRPBCC domain-containing protein n=1 Tax=Spongiactinospora sp. TRM90649 TaxID=3031114 RepID=UPI0023F6FB42|nr:SRPBCC domain-containing protein [Spongiactinospora sp. TRM90649]MDF5754933.1 SRPBCC domain-containing protein [Spongiactinospora sp. TRM90649]
MVPDTIERVVVLRHPIERVWAALTTAQGLSRWFGSVAEIDLRPGGRAFFRWDDLDDESVATIAVVDPPHRFAFRWAMEGLPEADAPQTLVDFTLEQVPDGTRLRVVESGFAQVSDDVARSARQANSQGWDTELVDLETYLDAAA